MLYDPEESVLRLAEGIGLPEQVAPGYTVEATVGVAGQVLTAGKALLVEDVRRDSRLSAVGPLQQKRYSSPSFLSVPIRSGERAMGVLNLSEKLGGRSFLASDLEVAGLLCNQLAIAMEKARLFGEIQESYQRLQEVDRLKGEFLSIAAHELRTPLSIILGYAMMLREDLEGGQQEQIEAIVDSALQLTRLVDDMTNLRYLEAGEVALVPHQLWLQEIIGEVVDRFRQLAQKRDQEIVCDAPEDLPPVPGDREKIALILSNLLSNATKFTPGGGQIRVWAEPCGVEVKVGVADTGKGIEQEEWEQIFEPFYQVEDSLRREHGGMGLGLSIARELVRLHKGRIWVESEIGRGSTFFFTLPRADVRGSG